MNVKDGRAHECMQVSGKQLPGGTGVTTTGVARVTATGETATVEATRAGGRATLALLSTLDADVAALEVLAVKSGDGSVGTIVVGEGDKTEATGAASLTVTDDDGVLDVTELGELGAETLSLGSPGETTNEKLNGHRNRTGLKERGT